MKQLLLFIILFLSLLFSTNEVKAQDLIVTEEGDSINCSIIKVSQETIFYYFDDKDGRRVNSKLPMVDVYKYQFGYFSEETKEENKRIKSEENKDISSGISRFRLAGSFGYGYRYAAIPDGLPNFLQDYLRELKLGLQYSVEGQYFITEEIGLGAKFSRFNSSNSLDNILVVDTNGQGRVGTLSDDITISYTALQLVFREYSKNQKDALIVGLSLGLMNYNNTGRIIDPFVIEGNTLGVGIDVGYDIDLGDHLQLGFQISVLSGFLTEYDFTIGGETTRVELEEEEYEGLQRIELSVGLRFYK